MIQINAEIYFQRVSFCIFYDAFLYIFTTFAYIKTYKPTENE